MHQPTVEVCVMVGKIVSVAEVVEVYSLVEYGAEVEQR